MPCATPAPNSARITGTLIPAGKVAPRRAVLAAASKSLCPAGSFESSATPGACKAGPFLPRCARSGTPVPPGRLRAAFPAPGAPALHSGHPAGHQVEAPNGAVIEVFATRNGTVEVHGPCVDLHLAGVHAFVAALQDSAVEAAQLVAAEAKLGSTIAKPDTPVGSLPAHVGAARRPADAATETSAAPASPPNAEAVMCVWV